MPTPPTLTFTPEGGAPIDLNNPATYQYLTFSDAWSAPPAEVDVIGRTQRGGVSIPYAAVGEREFELRLVIEGSTAEDAQSKLNALIAAMYITLGSNEPRFGVLTFDGYGAGSDPIAIRCAAKQFSRERRGLSYYVSIVFTSESGIWYSPTRVAVPAVTVSLGNDLPVTGTNAAFPGDPPSVGLWQRTAARERDHSVRRKRDHALAGSSHYWPSYQPDVAST